MEHQPVVSSNIESVAYDPVAKVMEVRFRAGSVYRHDNVSLEEVEAFRNAESIGKHYNQFFRNVRCTKVTATPREAGQ